MRYLGTIWHTLEPILAIFGAIVALASLGVAVYGIVAPNDVSRTLADIITLLRSQSLSEAEKIYVMAAGSDINDILMVAKETSAAPGEVEIVVCDLDAGIQAYRGMHGFGREEQAIRVTWSQRADHGNFQIRLAATVGTEQFTRVEAWLKAPTDASPGWSQTRRPLLLEGLQPECS